MLKKIPTLAFFICSSFMVAQNVNITVSFSGLKNSTGMVNVGLFNSNQSFLKTTFKSISSEIKSKKATVTFKNIPKGNYALSAYHDENKNNQLDKNLFGIPKENYACSNNAKGFMGPPKYEDAQFSLEQTTFIEIKFNN